MKSTAFFDHLFPEAGGWERLVAIGNARPREQVQEGPGGEGKAAFSPTAIRHLNMTFQLLRDDPEAQATLAHLITFTQKENDNIQRL